MASRTWLAVALCLVIWFLYLKWFAPPPPNIAEQQPAAPLPTPPKSTQFTSATFLNPPKVEESVRFSNEKMDVAFSQIGGRISQIGVKKYRESLDRDAKNMTPVDANQSPFSLAVLFTDPALSEFTHGSYSLNKIGESLQFYLENTSKIRVQKNYYPKDNGYLIKNSIQIQFPDGEKRNWGNLIIPVGTAALQYDLNDPLKSWEVVSYQNESVVRTPYNDLKEEKILQGSTEWISFGNRYFASALIHGSGINPDIGLVSNEKFSGGYLSYPLNLKPSQKEISIEILIYGGPKEYEELSKTKGLKQLIDYGMFSSIAYPLLVLLKFFNKFAHNYGIAIILLTLLVRAIFYPLSLKSYRSMKSLQKLQPQIAVLKEKYKEDKERFNREQLALFKAHKVNPAGGCLPMLVQLPVFIALYAVLGNSIELFQAPFFGWIKDLSTRDPYYIYPILMGISMFIQQKMTPTVGMDPMQAKMMLLMPVIFTFIMLNLPSGLTVYIFLSTILGILQQLAINKDSKKQELIPVKTAPSTSK